MTTSNVIDLYIKERQIHHSYSRKITHEKWNQKASGHWFTKYLPPPNPDVFKNNEKNSYVTVHLLCFQVDKISRKCRRKRILNDKAISTGKAYDPQKPSTWSSINSPTGAFAFLLLSLSGCSDVAFSSIF